jgi:TonB family protein
VKRGLVLSAVAHAALFVLVLAGPRPGTQAWELPEAIPVTLVSAVEEPAAEPPREEPPPAPEPEKQTEVEPEVDRSEPEPESEPPPPEPVSKPREIRRRPPRTYHPYAPERRDEPSLAERLQARLEDTEAEPAEAAATPEHAAAPASSTSAHSTEVEAGDSDFPFAWYLNLLRTKITDSWDPPGDRLIAGRSRQVIVSFRIARDGSVTDVRVQSGSETPGLDASARRAVERAKPFPPLPESYGRDVLDVAVRFTVAEGGR